jgi:hypothetical protein
MGRQVTLFHVGIVRRFTLWTGVLRLDAYLMFGDKRMNTRMLIVRALLAPVLFSAAWLYYPHCNDGPTFCLWKRFLDFDCPGCGLTRAACLLSHGQYTDAFAMNWRIVLVTAIIAAISFRAANTLFGRMRHRAPSMTEEQQEGEMVWDK